MLERDSAAADGQYLIVAGKVSYDHAGRCQGAEGKGVEQELGYGKEYQLQHRKIVYLLEQDSLSDEQDLVDEEYEEEKKERHDEREQILSSHVAVY